MRHTYHLTRVSGNRKCGPIPVSTTSKSSCPDVCPFKNNGCYADGGPLAIHWRAVSANTRGYDLDHFCADIRRLPKHQLWRYAQAGDLPGDTRQIDGDALDQIIRANANRKGFAYTHYSPNDPANAGLIKESNKRGFTVNLSANNLEHADELADLCVGPVVTVLPTDQLTNTTTPAGRAVVVCPAVVNDDINCANCGICAVSHRKAIIGFPAHGSGAKKAQRVFFMKQAHSDVQ